LGHIASIHRSGISELDIHGQARPNAAANRIHPGANLLIQPAFSKPTRRLWLSTPS
jgi:hypothetical protein